MKFLANNDVNSIHMWEFKNLMELLSLAHNIDSLFGQV